MTTKSQQYFILLHTFREKYDGPCVIHEFTIDNYNDCQLNLLGDSGLRVSYRFRMVKIVVPLERIGKERKVKVSGLTIETKVREGNLS